MRSKAGVDVGVLFHGGEGKDVKQHVCVEFMRSSFGRWEMMGLLVGGMIAMGVAVVRK